MSGQILNTYIASWSSILLLITDKFQEHAKIYHAFFHGEKEIVPFNVFFDNETKDFIRNISKRRVVRT